MLNRIESSDKIIIQSFLPVYEVIQLVAPGVLKSKLMELYREAATEHSAALGEDEKTRIINEPRAT